MPDNPVLSVIIVTWNSGDEITRCIDSIKENFPESGLEIIVIDNNSSDNTLEFLKGTESRDSNCLHLIVNKENIGYTKACNQGIEISKGDYILLLNPDTEILDGALEKLISELNSSGKTGAAAPKLLNDDGSIQKSCRTFPGYSDMFFELTLLSRIFPESRTFSRWKMNYFDHDSRREVDQPMAAALMVKRKVMETAGGFDERFIMFFNDVDLCRKIHDSGFKIIFCPEAVIRHSKGVSIYKDRERMIRIWNKDCSEYFRKYHGNTMLLNLLKAGLKISEFVRIFLYKLSK
ncbi:MAG: glycosyltransferase family 2 protein [Bacteroidetes bacterium]|nr:glycosyltransferase family 2 protein [Bacteroidota bacterium]